MATMSLPPPDPSSPAATDLPAPPDPVSEDPDAATDPEDASDASPGFLSRRWALPVWGWLVLGVAAAAVIIGLVATRPEDDTKQVAELQAQVAAKDAELAQSQADAQQEAFDDVQEVRDEAERQLSDAASAREQAEQALELVTQEYADLVAFEITRVQTEAITQACSTADAAGYAQGARPDPTTFGPAAAEGLPADASVKVLAALDQAAISAKVDECYQTGSDRYLSQTTTTTTTTVPPEPAVADPGAIAAGQTPS